METIYFSGRILPKPSFSVEIGVSLDYAMTRRTWLTWSAAALVVAVCPSIAMALPADAGKAEGAPASLSLATLAAAVDTLIPADAQTPSASTLGIAQLIANQADADSAFRPWLIEGLKWCDQGVPGSFAQRDVSARTALMQTLADSPVGSQTRIFFELLRLRTMTAYYADPRSRIGLAIERPPQPIGYPDFAGRT